MIDESPSALSEIDAPELANVGDTTRASWPFSLHQIRSNIAHCNHEGKEALISAFLWCIDPKHPLTRDEFAARINSSGNTIYKILAGKYRHPENQEQRLDISPALTKAIKNFLVAEKHRYVGTRVEIVRTPTFKRICTFCDLIRESRSPGFLLGPSHCGKTTSLEQYASENNHGRTVYVRMKAASGLGGMIRRLAEKVGCSPNSNTAELIERIKRALTPDMLVILDELHLLANTYRRASFFACIEVIREIHDEVGCGMVLCGTTLFLDKLQEGNHKEMEQMLRRGVHRLVLPQAVPKYDIAPILEHHGLEFPKAALQIEMQGIREKPFEILRQLAASHGLKAICERVRYARKLADRAEERVTWAHFVDAHLTIKAQANVESDWAA